MADDSTLRSFRSNDPSRRSSAAAGSYEEPAGSDPLAELARLIGQSDPFADLGRKSAPRADSRRDSGWPEPAAEPAYDSRRAVQPARDPYAEPARPVASRHSYLTTPNHNFDEPAAPADAYDDDQYSDGSYPDQPQDLHYADSRSAVGQRPVDRHARDDRHIRDDGAGVDARDFRHQDLHRQDHQDPHHHDTPHQDARYAAPADDGHDDEQYFFDDAAAPHDERTYDDPPRTRRQGGLLTAIVLISCAMFGTAAAYGYRNYYSGSHSSDAPIITADTAPSKLVPAGSGDAQTGKSIQDRLSDSASGERIVRRQEEPVTLPDPATAGPRVVLPAPFTSTPGPAPGQAAQPASPAQAGPQGEPKKVRTVTIRPDGSDPSPRPVPGAGSAPVQLAPPAPGAAGHQPPATRPSPPARSGGPLSLDPSSDSAAAYQSPSRDRVASIPPPSAPPRLAAAPSTGAYVVQVSSQRSESEAQSSFRSLQSKFPNQLGDRQAIVKRADLGPKGVYYRAMVGPFGTAGEADQFCNDLKAGGGQCIIQKN